MVNYFNPIEKIVLVSQSESRAVLLKDMGLDVIIHPSHIDESQIKSHIPSELVTSLASLKMKSYLNSTYFTTELTALSADTVVCINNTILGKAKDKEEAIKQLNLLSNNTHKVYTGFSLYYKKMIFNNYDVSDVTFEKIDKRIIMEYIESEEWIGAAGSYKVNGNFKKYIKKIEGDLNTVVGLPIQKISEIIKSCV